MAWYDHDVAWNRAWVRRERTRVRRQAEAAWRVYDQAVEEALAGEGFTPERQAWIDELARAARMVEAYAERLWEEEQRLAGEMLRKGELRLAIGEWQVEVVG